MVIGGLALIRGGTNLIISDIMGAYSMGCLFEDLRHCTLSNMLSYLGNLEVQTTTVS